MLYKEQLVVVILWYHDVLPYPGFFKWEELSSYKHMMEKELPCFHIAFFGSFDFWWIVEDCDNCLCIRLLR